jgi:TetR/AcrR family transcriptional regulator, regulator of cefoperazone and chloramphenicol sensitivity
MPARFAHAARPDLAPHRARRQEVAAARDRLLLAGLRLFAEQGYARTSTRELADAAGVNVAAISYYFGDKAGLYRAAFVEPLDTATPPLPPLDVPMALGEALDLVFESLLSPLNDGERARWCIQLHFREMVEPTGLWAEEIEREILPMHQLLRSALDQHLARHTTAPTDPAAAAAHCADSDEVARLALSIAGLAVHLHVAQDVVKRLEPQLLPGPATSRAWQQALRRYALAMVDAEVARREARGQPAAAAAAHSPVAPSSASSNTTP